jgi:hypothetical protein
MVNTKKASAVLEARRWGHKICICLPEVVIGMTRESAEICELSSVWGQGIGLALFPVCFIASSGPS